MPHLSRGHGPSRTCGWMGSGGLVICRVNGEAGRKGLLGGKTSCRGKAERTGGGSRSVFVVGLWLPAGRREEAMPFLALGYTTEDALRDSMLTQPLHSAGPRLPRPSS